MKKFEPYVVKLQHLANASNDVLDGTFTEIKLTLDGQPSKYLRDHIKVKVLRESGAFFTGHQLASKLAEPFFSTISSGAKILDPACGAGDLLIACAKKLPLKKTFEETLKYWGVLLYGYDIHEQFVVATKLRLVLLAKVRCNYKCSYHFDSAKAFPNIKTGDFFKQNITNQHFDLVLMNPPYYRRKLDKSWTKGLSTVASCFFEKCLQELPASTHIGAILPDVLRTGSRYAAWRELIEKHSTVNKIRVLGKFDALTDVDVFQLEVCSGHRLAKTKDWFLSAKAASVLGDYFKIAVGSVVPFRDPHLGPRYLYIDTALVPPGKTIIPQKHRRYNKKVFQPPFVVIRRTSGPSDKIRAVASIITGDEPVAVENHLIVIKPLSGGFKACRKALKVLTHSSTTIWLNKRIRCRHLTVSAVHNIPWVNV